MTKWVLLLMLARLCAGAAQVEPQAFHASVNLANVTASVKSPNGALLTDLTQEDFEVLEDGVPQTIQFFARRTDLPLSLGLIVDVSGSQEHFLKLHNRDIEVFLQEVLRPSDEAFAVCFGNHLRLVSDLTSSAAAITSALRLFTRGNRDFPEIGPKETRDLGTALFDAVYFSTTEKLPHSSFQRRALIVFSDGEENSSEHDLLDTIQAAQREDALVYCIRYTPLEHGRQTARNRYGIRVLGHLASQTGAADFDAFTTSLPEVFAQIGDEMRSLYEIGYPSTHQGTDRGFRKVTIRCRREGAIVRAKSGYYVP